MKNTETTKTKQAEARAAEPEPNVEVTAARLNVREDARDDAKIIGVLHRGDKLVNHGALARGFIKIEANNRDGYVKAEYTKPINGVVQPLGE